MISIRLKKGKRKDLKGCFLTRGSDIRVGQKTYRKAKKKEAYVQGEGEQRNCMNITKKEKKRGNGRGPLTVNRGKGRS